MACSLALGRAPGAADFSPPFSKAFNASPEPITISTLAEGRYIDANDSFLRLTGYEREEMVGRTSRELQFWGEPEQQSRVLQVLTNKAAVRDVEVALRTKSGALRVGLLSAEIIRIGDEPCLLAVTKDITEAGIYAGNPARFVRRV